MKKMLMLCIMLLLFPALILTGGFLLPPQYEETFLGELKDKCGRLEAAEGKKIVFVGGSSVAFGIDSRLVEQEFPGYEAVNFGMYAALGTKPMLDLSKNHIGQGDIVMIIPEQQSQTLSMYFDGESMWQALDGAFPLLREIPGENLGNLLGTLPYFSAEKWKCFLTDTALSPAGIYRRDSFNEYGDLDSEMAASNIMQDLYDANMPVLFERDMIEEAFADYLNKYAKDLQQKGAAVWYHFCPMNALAVEDGADVEGYYDALMEALDFDIAGNPKDCIMEAGWFYDTNFHLNSSGKTVYTKQLIKDMKAMLGDSSKTDIELPKLPEAEGEAGTENEDNSDRDFFLWEIVEGEPVFTGLTEEGKLQKELTVPCSLEGLTVHKINAALFSGNETIEKIILQSNITFIEDGAFAGCENLKELILLQEDPSKCLVGQGLLEGTDCRILVPSGRAGDYKLHYLWSVYSDRIREGK